MLSRAVEADDLCSSFHSLHPPAPATSPLLGTDTEAPSLLENDQALFLKGSCWITAGWPFNWGSHEYLTFHSLSGVGKQMRRGSLFEKHDCALHFFLKKCLGIIQTGAFCPSVLKPEGILSVLNYPKDSQVTFVLKSIDILFSFLYIHCMIVY